MPGSSAPNGVLDGTGLPRGCTRDLVHRFYQKFRPIPLRVAVLPLAA